MGSTVNLAWRPSTQECNDGIFNVIVDAPLYGNVDGRTVRAVGRDADGNAYVPDGNGGFLAVDAIGTVNGFGSTERDYVDLAWATGGAAWDLNLLRAGGLTADSFTAGFVDIKGNEIEQQVRGAPEPSALMLFGLGLLGLSRMARRAG